MRLPIYKLTIKDDEDTGVDFVALVDEPAIERDWIAFKGNQKPLEFKVESEEKRMVSGALMVANLPIYRRDEERGEYYVKFDSSTILSIVKKYSKNGFQRNVNLMHDKGQKAEGVYMIESFIIDSNRGINTPKGFDKLPDGSWFGTFKVDNDVVWAQIKEGNFKGFSVEGVFEYEFKHDSDQAVIDQVIDIIQNNK